MKITFILPAIGKKTKEKTFEKILKKLLTKNDTCVNIILIPSNR